MSTKNSSDLNDLECPICNNKYDFADHLPKSLTCNNNHITCLKCLKSLISKDSPTCPFDRSEIDKDLNSYQNCSMVQLLGTFLNKKGVQYGANINEVTKELNNELTKLGYDLKTDNWLENFIQEFSIRGKSAIDVHVSNFGVRDSERMRKAVESNYILKIFKGASTNATKGEVKSELKNLLYELEYDENKDGEEWLGDFIHEFCNKGTVSIDDYEAKFGIRDATKLRTKLQNNAKIISYVKLIKQAPKNVSKRDASDELEKILHEFYYEKDTDSWIDDFTQTFTSKGFEAIDEFKHKLGVKDAAKIKTRIENSDVLNLFLKKLKPTQTSTVTKKEAIYELEKLLSNEDYDPLDNPWLESFIKKFSIQGVGAIEEFSSKFGERDLKKIKKAIMNNSKLLTYSNSLDKEQLDNDERQDESLTVKKALSEIKKILTEMGYDISKPEWLTRFLEDFSKNGLLCLGSYNSLFGERDFKELKRLAFNNKILLSFNVGLSSHNNISSSETNNFKPVVPPRPPSFRPQSGYVNEKINELDGQFSNIMQPLSNQSIYPNLKSLKKNEKDLVVLVLGATGAGKSSLINLLYLWSKKISNLKEIKEVLIPTKFLKGSAKTESNNTASQDQSQTQCSAVHRFQLETDNKIYNLAFMDTPGLGDVRGIQKDDENVINILETVSNTSELNCIILMMNGSEPRVSDRIKYIIQRLIGIIPNVVRENLIVLLSNVRFTPNLDVNTIGVNVPDEKRFYIDNLLFSLDFANTTADKLREVDFEFQSLKNKMTLVLEMIETLRFQTTDNFRKLKEKRDEFKIEIDKVRMFLEDKLKEKRKLEQLMKDIIDCESQRSQLDLNKFKAETEDQWVDESTDPVYNTRCITCKSNCHLQCNLAETNVQGENIFKNCAAMKGDYCSVCEHKFDQHTHWRSKYVKTTRTKQVIDGDIANQIKTQDDLIKNKQLVIDNIKAKNTKLDDDVVQAKTRIFELLTELQSYCSDFNYVKELQLTKTLLEARIDYLQGEYSKSKKQKDKDEIETALMSKVIIEGIMQFMFNGDMDNAYKMAKKNSKPGGPGAFLKNLYSKAQSKFA